MRWLPPGLAAHAIQDASDGRPGMAFARLGALAAAIVVFGWLWVRSLSRALVTADTTTQAARVRGAKLPLGGLGIRGAVAARFWLYQRRDPTSLVYWALVAVITAAVSASSLIGQNRHPGVILASAVFGAAFVGIFLLWPRSGRLASSPVPTATVAPRRSAARISRPDCGPNSRAGVPNRRYCRAYSR